MAVFHKVRYQNSGHSPPCSTKHWAANVTPQKGNRLPSGCDNLHLYDTLYMKVKSLIPSHPSRFRHLGFLFGPCNKYKTVETGFIIYELNDTKPQEDCKFNGYGGYLFNIEIAATYKSQSASIFKNSLTFMLSKAMPTLSVNLELNRGSLAYL